MVVLFIVKDRQHTYIYMYIYFYTFIGIHNHPKTMCFIMCPTETEKNERNNNETTKALQKNKSDNYLLRLNSELFLSIGIMVCT